MRRKIAHLLLLLLPLGLTALVYWPGLGGDFLFDDFGSLAPLGEMGGIRSLDDAFGFMLTGTTGPGGRPLALASFLIDGTNWPTDPRPFKVTNLILHLLIGIALFELFRRLAKMVDAAMAPWQVGLLGMSLWLLHPLNVSTTLFVVQRMTQLSAFFVVLGLIAYLKGRAQVEQGSQRGYLWMSAGLVGCGILGFYSKENAILLPLLAGVIEFTLLRPRLASRLNPTWMALFFAVPWLLVTGYLAMNISFGEGARGYSSFQRLFYEATVLLQYAYDLLIPKIQTKGLFHGEVVPPLTLGNGLAWGLAWLAIAGAGYYAWRTRARNSLIAAAILFFLTGHLVESTTINLDPYYEHRNYLPAILLFFALSVGLVRLARVRLRLGVLLGLAVLLIYSTATYLHASLWGQPALAAEIWAMKSPASVRAQLNAAAMAQFDDPARAIRHLDEAIRYHPDELAAWLNKVITSCQVGRVTRQDIEGTRFAARTTQRPGYSIRNFEHLTGLVINRHCTLVTPGDLETIAQALSENQVVRGHREMQAHLRHVLGQLALAQGRFEQAAADFRQVALYKRELQTIAAEAALLATYGQCRAAIGQLDAVAPERLAAIELAPLSPARLLKTGNTGSLAELKAAIARNCIEGKGLAPSLAGLDHDVAPLDPAAPAQAGAP